jgi:GntR family transcriptional regulator
MTDNTTKEAGMVSVPYSPEGKRIHLEAFAVQRELDHRDLLPEHILLGILRVSPDLIERGDQLEARLIARLKGDESVRVGHKKGKYNWSDSAKLVLRNAVAAAAESGATHVGAEHILSGIASTDDEIERYLQDSQVYVTATQPPDPILIEVTDDSTKPFYVQIVDQVRLAVAEGRLIPGEQLPPVRTLADSLDLAPGTVARAYRQLQEEGVIVTDGSRGTTVAPPKLFSAGEEQSRIEALANLMRPTAVTAYHMGSSLDELLKAVRLAAEGVFETPESS